MHNPDFLSDTPRPAAAQLIIIITIIIMSVVEDDTVRDPNEERCRLVFPATRAPKSHCRTAVGRLLTAHAPHSQTACQLRITTAFVCCACAAENGEISDRPSSLRSCLLDDDADMFDLLVSTSNRIIYIPYIIFRMTRIVIS